MLTMITNCIIFIIGRYNWIFDKKLCICFMLSYIVLVLEIPNDILLYYDANKIFGYNI